MKRLKGLIELVRDAVDAGSTAVEKIHRGISGRTFAAIELVPPVAAPARVVHLVHDAILTGVYGSIRVVNRVAGGTAGVVIDAIAVRNTDDDQSGSPDTGNA